MRRIQIYRREVLERTGFRDYPFKKKVEYIISLSTDTIRNGHYRNYNDKNLKIPFKLVLDTRKHSELSDFVGTLTNCNDDKWLKVQIAKMFAN